MTERDTVSFLIRQFPKRDWMKLKILAAKMDVTMQSLVVAILQRAAKRANPLDEGE